MEILSNTHNNTNKAVPPLTCIDSAVGQAVVAELAQCAKSVLAGGADAHGGVRLHHHSSAAGLAGTVDHVGHEVQTGLEQQTVITGKQLFIHQLLHLREGPGSLQVRRWPIRSTHLLSQPLSYLQRCS